MKSSQIITDLLSQQACWSSDGRERDRESRGGGSNVDKSRDVHHEIHAILCLVTGPEPVPSSETKAPKDYQPHLMNFFMPGIWSAVGAQDIFNEFEMNYARYLSMQIQRILKAMSYMNSVLSRSCFISKAGSQQLWDVKSYKCVCLKRPLQILWIYADWTESWELSVMPTALWSSTKDNTFF